MRYGLVRVPERLRTHASVACHTITDLQARRAHTNLGSEASGESVSRREKPKRERCAIIRKMLVLIAMTPGSPHQL